MSLDDYGLSVELVGHSLDVRSVAASGNTIVSGSRDKTAKVWAANADGSYNEAVTFANHTNFVSSVCFLDDGRVICTGSNDSTICVYDRLKIEPVAILKGHSSTVSCLAAGSRPGTLISGSWDKTAIVWQISNVDAVVSASLRGHEAAVWSVVSCPSGNIVTGSADKTIIYWNSNGEKLKVLKGHTDCVRSLLVLDNGGLVSAGNDAVIKVWNEDGECIKDLYGHTNYIYSIAFNKPLGDNVIVSCGEDSTLRMWNLNDGPLGEPITLPAESVWSVACEMNGDIVTGSSDGIIRVFTKEKNRYANDIVQSTFQMAVEARTREANATLGGVKVNELPGPEALLQKGRTEGQTKMIRFPDGRIVCHEWSGGKWNALGDVVGAAGGTQASSGKKLYQGKEYDYVFDVDISDTMPPLKLPYNRGEDPWMAAQQFIHQHELPQTYLDQVANFIVQNSESAPVTAAPASSSYQDPFTGAGRYIPGSGNDFSSSGGNVDPFTGASSYSTSSNPSVPVNFVPRSGQNLDPLTGGDSHTSGATVGRKKHFPFAEYITIATIDSEKVLTKLKEFNGSVDQEMKVDDSDLDEVIKMVDNKHYSVKAGMALEKILTWPKQYLFPVLDVLRMISRDEISCAAVIRPETVNTIVQNVGYEAIGNKLMSIRSLSNMLTHKFGREMVDAFLPNVLVALSAIKSGTKNLQYAIATLLLNLSIPQLEKQSLEQCQQINETIIDLLLWSTDMDSVYSCYRAFGNLLSTQHSQVISAQIISTDDVMDKLRVHEGEMTAGGNRLMEIAKEVISVL